MTNEQIAIAEVLRCTRGVVRTAHQEKIRQAVVPEWWDALHNALATLDQLGASVAGEAHTQ